MKIKRYTAPSMREALARVRAEQGADAVKLRRGEIAGFKLGIFVKVLKIRLQLTFIKRVILR